MRQYTTWRYGITGRGEGRAVQERGNGGRGEGGDVGAIAMVGQCYFRGSDGFEKVHTKALEWWERVREGGNTDACVSAGAVHYNGAGGIKVDRRKAFEWYQKGGDKEVRNEVYGEDLVVYDLFRGIMRDIFVHDYDRLGLLYVIMEILI